MLHAVLADHAGAPKQMRNGRAFAFATFFYSHMTARISVSGDYLLRLLSFQTEISTRPTRYQFNVGDLRPHFGAFATLCLGVASSTAEP
jgi:hypothetical protein